MNHLALIQNTDTPEVEATDYAPKEVGFVKPFEQQLQLIEGEFSKFVFDYSNPSDNEAARSLIRKLQKSRAAIERVAKAERDPAILYQRHVIAEENKLTIRVQKLIDQYEKPLKEWEAKDNERKAAIQATIAAIRPPAEWVLTASAHDLTERYTAVMAISPDEGFGEFSAEAFAARITTLEYLKEHVAIAEKREADAARLAQLEREAEERRIADEQAAEAKRLAEEAEAKRIADEAAEKKRQEEAAAQAERDRIAAEEAAAAEAKRIEEAAEAARKKAEQEAAEREQKLKDEAAAAEAARIAAEEKAAKDAQEAEARRVREAEEAKERERLAAEKAEREKAAAVQAEKDRQAREQAEREAEEARKAADRAHRGKIHGEIVAAMTKPITVPGLGDITLTEQQAKAVVVGICGDLIPHLKITY